MSSKKIKKTKETLNFVLNNLRECDLFHIVAYDSYVFFFNDTATTEIYTLSLHDALPTSSCGSRPPSYSSRSAWRRAILPNSCSGPQLRDRKSTRLNSSHQIISYAVF